MLSALVGVLSQGTVMRLVELRDQEHIQTPLGLGCLDIDFELSQAVPAACRLQEVGIHKRTI